MSSASDKRICHLITPEKLNSRNSLKPQSFAARKLIYMYILKCQLGEVAPKALGESADENKVGGRVMDKKRDGEREKKREVIQ